jgi:hypothetical protein
LFLYNHTLNTRAQLPLFMLQYRISPSPSHEQMRSSLFGWKSNDITDAECPINVRREKPGCRVITKSLGGQKSITMKHKRKKLSQLTLSASQTRTVLSKDDVARRGMLGLKRTSVINDECSSSVVFGFKESVYHNTACITISK